MTEKEKRAWINTYMLNVRINACLIGIDFAIFRNNLYLARKNKAEVRFNPYHDNKGRFTTKAGNVLTNVSKSGKLKDSEEYGIAITDEAIKKVQKLNAFDSDEINTAVQMYSKQILSDMKNHKVGTEEGIAMPLNLNHKAVVKIGDEGAYSVKKAVLDEPYVFIHNHPSGKTFSYKDFDSFTGDKNCIAMYVVGNNGKMYLAKKKSNFNFARFGIDLVIYERDISKFIEVQNGKEIDYLEK